MATKSYRTRFRDFFLRGSAVWEKGVAIFGGLGLWEADSRIRYPRLIVPNSGIKAVWNKTKFSRIGVMGGG